MDEPVAIPDRLVARLEEIRRDPATKARVLEVVGFIRERGWLDDTLSAAVIVEVIASSLASRIQHDVIGDIGPALIEAGTAVAELMAKPDYWVN